MFFADVHTLGQARNGRGTLQAGSDDDSHGLTRRELEILALVAEGYSNGQMARKLWVTEQTVKFHLSNIYRKLDVANRTEAASWAHRHQLVAEAVEIT
jgi:DNA-binding CsgD family transcriptional regulator